jgi:NitT/TauT family transport system permease protein
MSGQRPLVLRTSLGIQVETMVQEEKEILVIQKEAYLVKLTSRRLAVNLVSRHRNSLKTLAESHPHLRKTIGWTIHLAYPAEIEIDHVTDARVSADGAAQITAKTSFGSRTVTVPELTREEAERLISEINALVQAVEKPRTHRSAIMALRTQFLKSEWVFVLIGLFVLWEILVALADIPADVIPTPSRILAVMIERGYDLSGMVILSYRNLLLGITFSALLATSLAFATGLRGKLDISLTPLVMLVYSLPDLALLPIIVHWVGTGALSAVFMCSVCAFAPIYFSVREGVKAIPTDQFEVVRIFGARKLALLKELVFPAAWPSLVTGFRLSFMYCWQIVLAIEMIALVPGIGYYIKETAMAAPPRLDAAFAGMLAVGIAVLVTDRFVFARIEDRIGRWRR